jgi:hypothetical protein
MDKTSLQPEKRKKRMLEVTGKMMGRLKQKMRQHQVPMDPKEQSRCSLRIFAADVPQWMNPHQPSLIMH